MATGCGCLRATTRTSKWNLRRRLRARRQRDILTLVAYRDAWGGGWMNWRARGWVRFFFEFLAVSFSLHAGSLSAEYSSQLIHMSSPQENRQRRRSTIEGFGPQRAFFNWRGGPFRFRGIVTGAPPSPKSSARRPIRSSSCHLLPCA